MPGETVKQRFRCKVSLACPGTTQATRVTQEPFVLDLDTGSGNWLRSI
jgi:hypothetical protein